MSQKQAKQRATVGRRLKRQTGFDSLVAMHVFLLVQDALKRMGVKATARVDGRPGAVTDRSLRAGPTNTPPTGRDFKCVSLLASSFAAERDALRAFNWRGSNNVAFPDQNTR